ncbi:PREDICTED: relaxin receptor 1-like [Branchiostoma belcheri]|uniref:Relaxin receptor 1-like n=1 Tax=Branchiostoma belcheri TaxID=7741 RepID=A0A6P4YRQ8_BRABE|nr:PREDICTED: relaxin receptor 1-like [Branchiostoma belcheri]
MMVGLPMILLATWMTSGTTAAPSPSPCPLGEFPCGNLTLCLPQRLHCNGRDDCGNNADEERCGDNNGWASDFDAFRATGTREESSASDVDVLPATGIRDGNSRGDESCALMSVPALCTCERETWVTCDSTGLNNIPGDIDTNVTRLSPVVQLVVSDTYQVFFEEKLILYSTYLFYMFSILLNSRKIYNETIETLQNDSFLSYVDLESLNLPRNKIHFIEPAAFRGLRNLKKLNLQGNRISSFHVDTFAELHKLFRLFLSHNELETLVPGTFRNLHQLEWLYLEDNRLTTIQHGTLSGLGNVHWLELEGNSLNNLTSGTFEGCGSITVLSLRNNRISTIEPHAFDSLSQLMELDLSVNNISTFPSKPFARLKMLDRLSITDVGVASSSLSTAMFSKAGSLDHIYFSKFQSCNFALHVRDCEPNSDGISSFEHLLARPVLRRCVWIIAALTCTGNTCVMIGRSLIKHENKVHSLFIKNLCASDLVMGIYLLIIGAKDVIFRGTYNRHALDWRESFGCQFTGFLAMLSSEVSVLLLTYMSVERFLCVVFPYRDRRPNVRQAAAVLMAIWLSGFFLAFSPLIGHGLGYFDNFYGSNGVCFPLHLHQPYLEGWEYSAFIFLGVNFTSLVIILAAYTGMFVSIQRTRRSIASSFTTFGDMSFATRFFFIVLTDSLVWIPITVLKFLAFTSLKIPGSMYAWIVIFILPINSAINPILYSLTTRTFTGALCSFVRKFHLKHIRASTSRPLVLREQVKRSSDSDTSAGTTCTTASPLTSTSNRASSNGTVNGAPSGSLGRNCTLDSVPERNSSEDGGWESIKTNGDDVFEP